MMRRLTIILLFSLYCIGASAQYARDTVSLGSSFKGTQLIAPAVFGASGAAVHFLWHDSIELPVHDFTSAGGNVNPLVYQSGNYFRYVPAVAHLGLGLTGVKSRHAFLDRSLESAISYFFGLGSGFVLKKLIYSPRPDGSGNDSFPSGHTIISVIGSELIRMDYGWGWGAGAYALSGMVAYSRLYSDVHWLGDILAGTGLGILSAHVGGWMLEPVKRWFNIPDVSWDGLGGASKATVAIAPYYDPLSRSYAASLALRF